VIGLILSMRSRLWLHFCDLQPAIWVKIFPKIGPGGNPVPSLENVNQPMIMLDIPGILE